MTGFWAWFHDGWEIVGALASAAAVIVAVWLASHERADRKQAEADRDIAREAQRRAELAEAQREREVQARRVAVWLHDDPAYSPELMGTRVTLGNYSDAPIFAVNVDARVHGGRQPIFRPLARVLPGQMVELVEQFPEEGPLEYVSAAVEFRDMAGVWWRRTLAGGAPEELDVPQV